MKYTDSAEKLARSLLEKKTPVEACALVRSMIEEKNVREFFHALQDIIDLYMI